MTGHEPLVSPCASCAGHSVAGIIIVCGFAPEALWQMVIISTGGWQINVTVCTALPETFVAVILKLAVPVNEIFEMVMVLFEKPKLTGVPFCVTAIPLRFET